MYMFLYILYIIENILVVMVLPFTEGKSYLSIEADVKPT